MINQYSSLMLRKLLLLSLLTTPDFSIAQSGQSLFPHGVGDRWDYWHSAFGYLSTVLTRDSLDSEGAHYLFYDGSTIPRFKIDSLGRVISNPTFANPTVLYELRADSGFVWRGGPWQWAWVARTESVWVFGRRTASKVFRYSPGHPDTTGWHQYYEEHRLAEGIGKFYWEGEPAWVEFLLGCVIAGDTFGTLVTVPDRMIDLPARFSLHQNYPNPFNPATTIEIELPEASTVNINVYDVIGRQVGTIVEGKMAPGTHRFLWDAAALPSGVYFGRMQVMGNIQTIKMVLMR